MNKIYLLLLFGVGLFPTLVPAQSASSSRPAVVQRQVPVPYRPALPTPAFLESSLPLQANAPVLHASGVHYRNMEELAGSTTWDAQSYGCTQRRMYANTKGEPVINWLYSNEQSGFTDRGTANNTRDAVTYWPEVNKRVESVRTGFPAADRLADGTEVVISHATSPAPNRIHCARKAPGAAVWTNTSLPLPSGQSCLWPQMAIGGKDGRTIHVIAITTPTGNSGLVYQGVNGHLLYWRSVNGGDTWEIQYAIIPGCDSTLYRTISANNYTIDAQGDYVAVCAFSSLAWQDIPVFKSSDNGQSWNTLLMRDFPDLLENYNPVPGPLYTIDDIGGADPNAPTPLAILTNDGHGTLLIDPSGEVHAWFGAGYVVDNTDNDSSWFYYPAVNQLRYWKESFGIDSSQIITGALDYDGDGVLALSANEEIAPYNNASLASMPQAGIDSKGRIFLTYTAIHELYRTGTGDANDEFYRHVYVMRSDDRGDHWGQPLDIINVPYVDEFLIYITEAVSPVVPRSIGDKIWVSYVQDQVPGTNVSGNHHPVTVSNIMWVALEPDSVKAFVVGTDQPSPLTFRITPNPVHTDVSIRIDTDNSAPVQAMFFDVYGKCVQSNVLNISGGSQHLTLPAGHLVPGVYMLCLQQGQRRGTVKLIRY